MAPALTGPETVDPQAAGVLTAIVPISGPVERWSLDSGATVEFDLNHTIRAYESAPPRVGNVVLTGIMSQGRWVMQVGPGALDSPPDCFAVRLPAFDRPDSIEFVIEGDDHVHVAGGWRVRLAKTPTFQWRSGGSPAGDGTYRQGTRFCLTERGQVAGQLAWSAG
jgi:hypothetical protein